ncbi:MAG: DUF167 domain-containing protein [Planctomycetota bacterium]
MIRCKPDGDALRVPVRAQPGAARNEVVGEHAGALKVKVTPPAQDGRANRAIARTLAEALGVRKSQVRLASGRTSRDKVFCVRGITAAAVTRLAER